MSKSDDLTIAAFESKKAWTDWLFAHCARSAGLWLRLAKKGSGVRSVSYQEALEAALCYGWIDGQKRPESKDCWLQRFSPRGRQSIWSKVNREKAIALLASGEMKELGLAAVEQAKVNGRWEAAYDSSRTASVPPDFEAALASEPSALAFFESLDRANRYAILWRIQTVKLAPTRTRKIKEFVDMLNRKEKVH